MFPALDYAKSRCITNLGCAVGCNGDIHHLFTIYGAVLEYSKAGQFYVDFSLSATSGKPAAAGRTVTLASFLLGGPSGSDVATTLL